METHTLEFEVTTGHCPTGEAYASRQIAEKRIPVLSCEGPCIRGEIARLAANLVAREVPEFARACHGETFFVPQSGIARWVKEAERVLMIDGCFLSCHGRVLNRLLGDDKVVHVDALPFYMKYTDIFSMDEVPEDERKAVARKVADKIIARLKATEVASSGDR